jgi:hypothetical protein
MYIWTPVTERMLFLQQCSDFPFIPAYPTKPAPADEVVMAQYQEAGVAQYYSDPTKRGPAAFEQPTSPVYWDYQFEPRWLNDLDIVCDFWLTNAPDHYIIQSISFAGLLVWTVGVVMFGMLMLLRNQDSLHEVSILRKYGFLYLGYERKYWYWEAVKRFQQFLYRLVSVVNIDVKARLVMYSLLSGLFAILHVWFQPFDDRDNQKLDGIETFALVTAFSTQVLFQTLITFVLSLYQILTILLVILIINVMILWTIGGAFFQELMTHNGKKALEKERKALIEKKKNVRTAEGNRRSTLQRKSSLADAAAMAKKFNPAAWWGHFILEVGKRTQRRVNIKSRLCLLVSPEGQLMSRLIARTPTKWWTRYKYVWRDEMIPPEEPLEVNSNDAEFFWLIQKNTMDMILNEFGWDTVDCDLYEFMLRLLVALVMHERRQRADDTPIESQVHLELKNLLLVPTTDVATINKRIKVAENEGRILTFSHACERGGVDKEKLIHGDELFRSTMYASVMDKDVLFNLYKTWKKNKLMRVLPGVLREQYEKEDEEPEDAVKRMMATDPGWMQWTAQMHSQVHDTMGGLQQQKKIKMLEGIEKKNILKNNKVAGSSNALANVTAKEQASKPENFDMMLTNLLSSAAVDQAAEDLYRRAQAQTDSVEAVGRARAGLSNNGPSNGHPRIDNGPTNGNGGYPHGPTNGNGVDPPVLSASAAEQRRDDYYQLHGGGLDLNDVHVNVPSDTSPQR